MAEQDRLLHTLWTKAVGTPDYNKAEWRELAKILGSVEEPEPPTTGEVIDALKRHPELLFSLKRELGNHKVAGPWRSTPSGGYHCRTDHTEVVIGKVTKKAVPTNAPAWEAEGKTIIWPGLKTAEAAKTKVDEQLEATGWILLDGA